ncbi:hypothetical protein J2Y41_003833 [Arthrobacter sp. 1088]|uniref:hypothetical protein n=1 Tax=Arthrobacter sp. 1088 TaxID=2817768 RepID=UPI0028594DC7|nr:hypothetical protein [Arthrobacter sp. 1088]MDR6688247.1 hypothetical protein [Arthrobacter sp. 1088]
MELIDPHHGVMAAVLIVHCLGILAIGIIIVLLMFSLFIVIMTVHTIRSLWSLRRPPKVLPPAIQAMGLVNNETH